jgi:hypothetical protein
MGVIIPHFVGVKSTSRSAAGNLGNSHSAGNQTHFASTVGRPRESNISLASIASMAVSGLFNIYPPVLSMIATVLLTRTTIKISAR